MDEQKIKDTLERGINEVAERIKNNFMNRSGREMARQYITGLMSAAERKNGWQISEILGQSTPYSVQQFLYRGNFSADDLRDDLRDYVQDKLGDESGTLIVDETGFLKKGKKSVGVARQYSGTAGRIENCQIGVFLAYSSPKGYSIIDRELYLPKEWMDDRLRCEDAKIPEEVTFKNKISLRSKYFIFVGYGRQCLRRFSGYWHVAGKYIKRLCHGCIR